MHNIPYQDYYLVVPLLSHLKSPNLTKVDKNAQYLFMSCVNHVYSITQQTGRLLCSQLLDPQSPRIISFQSTGERVMTSEDDTTANMPLPPGWVKGYSNSQKKTYYCHPEVSSGKSF